MNIQFEILKNTRKFLLSIIEDLSIEELNEVPAGFNNNIIWNLGHLLASQQGLCYLRAGLPVTIEEKYYDSFKPGTKPDGIIDKEELENIRQLFLSAIDRFEKDYSENVFINYTPWTNRYGVQLINIEQALTFVNFHEGLHIGYVMALKKLVKKMK